MKPMIGKAVVVLALLAGCSDGVVRPIPGSGGEVTVAGSGPSGPSVAPGVAPGANPGVRPGGDAQAVAPDRNRIIPSEPATLEPGVKGMAVNVRMRAVGAEGFSSLVLVPNRLEAYADGKRVPVTTAWADVELTRMDHAELVGTVTVPENAQSVKFRVELGAAGGFETATSSGWVDTRNSVLEFERSMDDLIRNHNRTVVEVDAARSFAERDATSRVFVPNYRVY